MMKLEAWKLFLLSSICFLFVSITNLSSKNFVRGVMFLFLSITYFDLSRTKYKENKNMKKEI